jgi:hypothetical protein
MAESDEKREIGDTDLDEKSPAGRLMLFLRKNSNHPKFYEANSDFEHLDLARNFPQNVPDIDLISKRFKTFLLTIEDNEQALRDAEEILEAIKREKAKKPTSQTL